jgi:hypothetical protein
MDRYFDVIYYALSFGILLALGYSILVALNLRHKTRLLIFRQRAWGIILIALGTATALLGGLSADAFLKENAYFQQIRFALYDSGFALIMIGFTTIIAASQAAYPLPRYLSNLKQVRLLAWFLFLGALLVSAFYLIDPDTFVRNQSGFQTQRAIYFFPMLSVTFVGFAILFPVAFAIQKRNERAPLIWLSAYAALVFVGLLRESLILPDLGNPLTNLLVAFVPFFIGSLSLGFSAVSFRRLNT